MLTLIADPTGRKRFPVKHYSFASQPRKRHALTAAIYFQCQSKREPNVIFLKNLLTISTMKNNFLPLLMLIF
jgi:hypothetical protein